jgi:hypothetical protein
MTAATGMLRSSARREELGKLQVETRINFGEELPASHSAADRKHGRYMRALVDCNKVGSRLRNMAPR